MENCKNGLILRWKIVNAMLARKIDHYIEFHYKHNRSALLLHGARQVGKTWAIRKYARNHNLELLEINFYEDASARLLFENTRGADDVLLRISAYAGRSLPRGRTLIFFDEVQKCPECVTMIKFLVEEGSYLYALSGSLLGIELKGMLRSAPVGFLDVKQVYPLDLEEFFLAVGVQPKIIETVRKSWEDGTEVDTFIHQSLLRLVNLYLLVGGMPAVVQTYMDTRDMTAVQRKQREILALYQWDIAQYDPDGQLYIKEIFDLVPSQLNAKNKRFFMKELGESSRFSLYENGFIWLKDAGCVLPVYNVDEPKCPLKLAEHRNLFKLFQNDVGLLACQYASGTALRILSGETNLNFGAIYENLAAQELRAHGFHMYYFNGKKQGELDFLVEEDDGPVPVEIKSGKDYTRHNALRNILSVSDYGIKKAYVFCNANVSSDGIIRYLPVYMLMFISRQNDDNLTQIFVPDMSALQ